MPYYVLAKRVRTVSGPFMTSQSGTYTSYLLAGSFTTEETAVRACTVVLQDRDVVQALVLTAQELALRVDKERAANNTPFLAAIDNVAL